MIAQEIRMYTVRAAEEAHRDESQACASGTSDLLTLLGEIAAQLAEFNQNFYDLKRQFAGGYIKVATSNPQSATRDGK